MPRFPLLIIALATLAGSALAQPTPEGARATGDENEPYYPSYIYPVAPCEGGRSLLADAAAASVEGTPAAPRVAKEGDATVVSFNRDHQTWEEAIGFRYDSTHAMDAFTYKSSKEATSHAIVARVDGVTEFRDANANGELDEADAILQRFLVADDAHLLAEAQPEGAAAEMAQPSEPLASSSNHESPSDAQPGSPSTMEAPEGRSPYLLHMARDWRSPCAIQFKWTYFLSLDTQGFQAKLEKRDPAVFADEPRLALEFTNVGAAFDASGTPLVPERVKIDIGIDDFPFSAPDSLLAVRVTVLSKDALQKSGAGVSGAAGDARVGFSWAATAIADGKPAKVGARAEEIPVPEWHLPSWTEGARSAMLVTFSYPHAASILHDPEVGKLDGAATTPPTPAPTSLRVPALGLLTLVGVVGMLALASRRR